MLQLNIYKCMFFIISFVVDRSDEYPTTMMPVLTTPRETRAFDFVPVNIIRDDGKETSFRERNFGDFSDVSLVPAGTNSRIQVRTSAIWRIYERFRHLQAGVYESRRPTPRTTRFSRRRRTYPERVYIYIEIIETLSRKQIIKSIPMYSNRQTDV